MVPLRWLFSATLLFAAVHPVLADDDFVVGTCIPRLSSFATISAAVSSVPPGSTVLVCPGVYAEQVTISQPLTLRGIAVSDQDQAVIMVPSTGLVVNVTSILAEPVAAQVLVQSTGPVSLTNLSVDGTGGSMGCTGGTAIAGIFYAPGSSGEVRRVKASGQLDGGCGVGIWAENANNASQSVSIENNTVHDVDSVGILVASTSTLNASIRRNVVYLPNGMIGIGSIDVAGAITENEVSSAMFGIATIGANSLSSNTVSLATAGIVLEGGGTVVSNRISNSTLGVLFLASGGTVQDNRITSSSMAAVEFDCNTGTVFGNTINDAVVGLDQVSSSFSGSNNFNNTASIRTDGCATAAAVGAKGASVASPNGAQPSGASSQKRTPVSVFGLLN